MADGSPARRQGSGRLVGAGLLRMRLGVRPLFNEGCYENCYPYDEGCSHDQHDQPGIVFVVNVDDRVRVHCRPYT